MLENTEGIIKMDNQRKLTTYGTQDNKTLENTKEAIKMDN